MSETDANNAFQFKEIYDDFNKRKPCGKPTGRAYWFTKAWIDGRKSINDLLRESLIDRGITCISTIDGSVWFQYDAMWTRCEAEPDGNLVRFYMLEFEMG